MMRRNGKSARSVVAMPASVSAAESVQQIEMSSIDAPDLAVRAAMDEDCMTELMESMSAVGLRQPIAVRRAGKRYEVIAGHRRYVAAQRLAWQTIRCMVEDWDDETLLAMRLHENLGREDIHPVDEAYFFRELVDRYKYDEAKLCNAVKRSPDYVARRLRLLRGCPQVLESLTQRKITLGVAEELNKVTDSVMRQYYLYQAALGGHSHATVKGWVADWRARGGELQNTDVSDAEVPAAEPYVAPRLACELCGGDRDPQNLRYVLIHNYELAMLHDQLAKAKQRMSGEEE